MREVLELRINYDYSNLLFKEDEGKNVGKSVKIVEIQKSDSRYKQIPIIADEVKRKYNKTFFFGWRFKRKYTKVELEQAQLFSLKIKTIFEPTGEEIGTLYDEQSACDICGANRKQIGPLKLEKKTIPRKDIVKTIGGEIVVSAKFIDAVTSRNLKGLELLPVVIDNNTSKYAQLTSLLKVELSPNTIVGINPFDLSAINGSENYKCSLGDTIGLNLLSSPYVLNNTLLHENDFFISKQKIGVKRGLLRPESVYFCSNAFVKMVEEEKLTGFEFEIATID